MADEPCVWREDADGNWHTTCGHAFLFIEGGPSENDMVWCCYCNHFLVEQPAQEDTDG